MTQGSHNFVTSDRCVEMETALFSLPAILAFEKIFFLCDCSDPCVKEMPTEQEFKAWFPYDRKDRKRRKNR